jgi:hypothetical protein
MYGGPEVLEFESAPREIASLVLPQHLINARFEANSTMREPDAAQQ